MMATFNYSIVIVYQGRGDNAVSPNVAPFSGTLSDGEGDTTFEPGDFVTGGANGLDISRAYIGTTSINGQTWPVLFHENSNQSFVYMTQNPGTPPPILQVDENGIFCFASGTMIATPAGDVAVEALSIGDLVTTADGRAVPVKWVGRQTLAPLFQPVRLIRLAAGALGNGLPIRDLTVTADHALMIDGLLVNAGALVNGSTITVVKDLPERVMVYHIETEAHEIILAEGTPSETFIDYAGRKVFDNYAEFVALYGEGRMFAENPAPRITSARLLPVVLQAKLNITRAA